MNVQIERAQFEDAKIIADVFNASFYGDYIRYGACPGYNKTESSIKDSMLNHIVFKIMIGTEIVGAVSVKTVSDHSFFLGALCVVPEWANKGIGQQAMHFLDREFSGARHWALETPADKIQNHYFYKKFGYRVTKEYTDGNVVIAYFEHHL
ncbi:MAG: GNAT family N-acetyltransferase [Oscillospiraceae bacterium]|jgi:GNAT superfamily N-acetyltransferase|nr:GNAT family N-acetyltransferase [Oscillospiraceae bacterium]